MLPKKILIATVPADGHFNPLTGIAMHLKSLGHDVRWYTQDIYKPRLEKLGIRHYPFVKHPQLNAENFQPFFKERDEMKTQIAKFRFDLEHFFIRRSPEVVEDLENIHQEFPFELLIADILFMAMPMIKKRLNIPVIAAGIIPINESSKNLPPAGMGLTPDKSIFSGLRNRVIRFVSDRMIFKKPEKIYRELLAEYGVDAPEGNLFDILYRSVDMVWQSGSPGFEFERSDRNPKLRFIGPLLPYAKASESTFTLVRRKRYSRIVLVTQGTAEKNFEKIIAPTLEAFKDSDTLVIATTGKNGTAELRARYPQENLIIEDFIPFNDVMPLCDAYITNGGYGGVLLGVQNRLPMVVAGVHEGKNEICARVGYFKLGLNLKTETPRPEAIRKAVDEITRNDIYKKNVVKLSDEFSKYDTNLLVERSLEEIFKHEQSIVRTMELMQEKVTA
jgi:MGT family glycosyltransferase